MMLTQLSHINQGINPILVTGHTGFKGTWLTLLLDELNIEWIGVSLPPEKDSLYTLINNKKKPNEYFVDIRDINKLHKIIDSINPSHVIHLAAQALVLDSYTEPRNTFETNILGTYNILELLVRKANLKSIVVATTDKVYKSRKFPPMAYTESDKLGGMDPYSWSKVGAETVVGAWRQISKLENGPNIISVRAGNVIGGGDFAKNRLLPDLIKGFHSKSKITIRNAKSTRPWQHVLDPLYGYLLALATNINEPAFNFSPSKRSLSVKKVVGIASDSWGEPSRIIFNKSTNKHESKYLALNSKKAKLKLNWTNNWTQEEAVVSTVNWWKSVYTKKLTPKEACLIDIRNLIYDE